MSVEIQLTQGKVAVVDDCDADLAALKWCAHRPAHQRSWYAVRGYRLPGGRQVTERLHRVVWARAHPGAPAPAEVDHADGDGLNCRRSNIRAAEHRSNLKNQRLRRDNSSGFKGVSWSKALGRWAAYIRADGRRKFLGAYAAKEEAAMAYDRAARQLHAEFAALNFPGPGERSAA